MLNVAYAYLAERADAKDNADIARWGDVSEESRDKLGTARQELDEWLATPYGEGAAQEKAVIAYLTS